VVEHRVVIRRLPSTCPPLALRTNARAKVHVRRVEPHEERGLGLDLTGHEIDRRVAELLVDRFHPLAVQRPGVFDPLRAVCVGPRPDHPTRPEPLAEPGELLVSGIVVELRLLFGVQVIQVAEEFIEPVNRREELVAVAEVVLAELSRGVALCLHRRRNRWVLRS
jgi:hypothetical protein